MLDKIPEEDDPADFLENLHQHIALLKNKYSKMSVVQLKKQRLKSITDLKEIHELLNGLIFQKQGQLKDEENDRNTTQIIEIDQQIKYTKKRQTSLERSLENFEFMLTQEYDERLNQEINEGKATLKMLKKEVGLLRRQMEIPMQKQMVFCEQLQKQVFDLQQQIEVILSKNRSKQQQIKKIMEEIKQKQSQIGEIDQKRIKKRQKETELSELQEKNQNQERVNSLTEQKNKLEKIINTTIKSNKIKQNKIKKQRIDLEDLGLEIQSYIQEINRKIQQTTQQIKMRQVQLRKAKAQKRSSAKITSRNKYSTEPDDYQGRYRTGTANYSSSSYNKFRSSRNSSVFDAPETKFTKRYIITPSKRKQHRQNQFPSIYQFIGKKKLLVEDECDLKDLVYKGEG